MLSKLSHKFGHMYDFSVVESDPILPSLSKIRTRCKKHHTETDDLYLNMLHKPKPCLQCLLEEEVVLEPRRRRKRSAEDLVEDFEKKHGDKFMYHDIEYSFTTMKNMVWIKCKKHNLWFEQTPVNHLNTEICCPKCYDEFIESTDT